MLSEMVEATTKLHLPNGSTSTPKKGLLKVSSVGQQSTPERVEKKNPRNWIIYSLTSVQKIRKKLKKWVYMWDV